MKSYKTKLRLILPVEIEAESPEEAERIIDGILDNVTEVGVFEGQHDDPEDYLVGKPERMERDEIEVIS